MRDRTLSLTLAFLIPILFTLAMPYSTRDLSAWIALGLHFLNTGSILRHDIFSVLPTSEMVYPSFGASVLYGALYRYIGLIGVCIFHAVVVLPILLYLLYRPLIKSGILPSSKNTKWVLFLFWLGGVPTFGERPAMLALIPLVISFQIIAQMPPGELKNKDVLKLILIEIIWANLHGSFVLLPFMLLWKFFWSFRFDLKRAGLVWACFLAALLNPFGYKIYPFLFETARVSKERGITEWDFPGLATQFPTGILFWAVFIYAGFFLYQRAQAGALWKTFSNPFFLFVILGTLSIRNAALCFIVLLPGAYAARFFGQAQSDPKAGTIDSASSRRKLILNTAVALVAILAIPLVAAYKPKKWDDDTAFALVDQIKKDGQTCSIFNDWEIGGFLMLELPNQTYLDTRNIIFSREEFKWYEQTLRGEMIWKSFLNSGHACYAIVNPVTSAGLIEKMKTSNEWELTASEGTHVLYIRKKLKVN